MAVADRVQVVTRRVLFIRQMVQVRMMLKLAGHSQVVEHVGDGQSWQSGFFAYLEVAGRVLVAKVSDVFRDERSRLGLAGGLEVETGQGLNCRLASPVVWNGAQGLVIRLRWSRLSCGRCWRSCVDRA